MAGGGTMDAAMAITAENAIVIAALNFMYLDTSNDGIIRRIEGEAKTDDIDLDQKPTANSSKLQNFINSLYKGQGNPNQIGNGTTMDSIRYELETGNPVEGKFHSQKGQEFMNGINKLVNSGS